MARTRKRRRFTIQFITGKDGIDYPDPPPPGKPTFDMDAWLSLKRIAENTAVSSDQAQNIAAELERMNEKLDALCCWFASYAGYVVTGEWTPPPNP